MGGNGESAACPGCHLRLEPSNRITLPDGTIVHRSKSVCTGMSPGETEVYERLARNMTDLAEAYQRATGKAWAQSAPALRSGRYAALRRPDAWPAEHLVS